MKWLIPVALTAAAAYLVARRWGAPAVPDGWGSFVVPDAGSDVTTDDNQAAPSFDGFITEIQSTMTPAPAGNPSTMSPQGLQMLQGLEGFAARPYSDHKGYSIGYGHLIKAGENLSEVSTDQALILLMSDVGWAQDAVASAITVPLTQGQFDALVSLCFNIGAGAFKRSTLVKRINAGDPGASAEFDRWNMASGQVNDALVARRQTERNLFDNSTS